MNDYIKKKPISLLIPLILIGLVIILFYAILPIYANYGDASVLDYAMNSWNAETGYEHGYLVIPLMILFAFYGMQKIKTGPVRPSILGIAPLILGIGLYVLSVRTIQPRLALFAFPFITIGIIYFNFGWRVAKHFLFPAFFLYFAITLPGLQQATNSLQLMVTKFCDVLSNWVGIETIIRGNNIESATGAWDDLKIAEGCSGIRSIVALTMISAIYAMYTQNKLWKKWFIFACALPIAIFTNALRIFTIIVIAEMGYGEFAAGVYHDYTGLVVFFPAALLCLFVIDKRINARDNKKKVVKTVMK